MANYKAMAERARKAAANAKADGARMVGMYGGAGVIGLMVKSGTMERLPDLGVPKTLIVAGIGKAIGYNMSGAFAQACNGLGDAGACVAIYQYTTGQTVSGVAGAGGNVAGSLDRERELARRLKAATANRLQGGDDVADLEALAEALPHAAE